MHIVDGFGLQFTARTSWKARRYRAGKLIDVVPVTWKKGFRTDKASNKSTLEVWYRDAEELAAQKASDAPFIVALVDGKDVRVNRVDGFIGLYSVRATGTQLSEKSIETVVLDRLSA